MTRFSDDRDLAVFEPGLFSDCPFATQVLCSGTGAELSGGVLSLAGTDFAACGIEPGGIVFVHDVSRMVEQVLEVLSVGPSGSMAVSLLRPDRDGDAILPADRQDVCFRVCSFAMQAGIVALELTERLGIRPGRSTSEYGTEHLLNAEDLRLVSVYGTLAKIYASLSTGDSTEVFFQKRHLYTVQFQRARERVLAELDTNLDGKAEEVRLAGIGLLERE